MTKLTQERLKELLDYDPDTGDFIRKISCGCAKKGDIAGSIFNGYIQTKIDGFLYKNHRLAWLYVYGYFPENSIDHIDRIKHHNKIDNLREVSNSCNLRNTKNYKNNKSGVKGVNWYKQNNNWMASIRVNNKSYYLGTYKHFDNAVCARLVAEQCLNWDRCDSLSPAFQYTKGMV